MKDNRVLFLSRETREVINFLAGLALSLLEGASAHDFPCFNCSRSFKNIARKTKNPFIFVVIKNWLSVEEEDVKFCCLRCCRDLDMMDVVEIHPSLSLLNTKKLMYNNILKKFVFNFKDAGRKKFKKHSITTSVEEVLGRVLRDKADNEEIEALELWKDTSLLARDVVYDLRVDYGTDFNFDAPLSLNPALAAHVDQNLESNQYYIEVHYKLFENYQPFTVYFNRSTVYECSSCRGKIFDRIPIFYCSKCGFTDPNYWTKHKTMMIPFWQGNYDYNKIYWKTLNLPNKEVVNLMLYSVDTTRIK